MLSSQDSRVTPRVQAIERVSGVSRTEFDRRFLSGDGVPVIVTDATDSWPARSKWTFSFFRTHCGSDHVTPIAGRESKAVRLMTLTEYIDYIHAPNCKPPGMWIHPTMGIPLKDPVEPPSQPLYLLDWNPFAKHPELAVDVIPSPYFTDDWLPLLPIGLRQLIQDTTMRFPICWVLIGPSGSVSAMHRDFWRTHACLAMIQGRKKFVLVAPAESEKTYDGAVDPEHRDAARFPMFSDATTWECVLERGELLFIPGGWWHYARGLEPAITFSYNFFNRFNLGDYIAGLLRDAPQLLRDFKRASDWRSRLGIDWVPNEFERLPGGGGR